MVLSLMGKYAEAVEEALVIKDVQLAKINADRLHDQPEVAPPSAAPSAAIPLQPYLRNPPPSPPHHLAAASCRSPMLRQRVPRSTRHHRHRRARRMLDTAHTSHFAHATARKRVQPCCCKWAHWSACACGSSPVRDPHLYASLVAAFHACLPRPAPYLCPRTCGIVRVGKYQLLTGEGGVGVAVSVPDVWLVDRCGSGCGSR